MNEMIDFFTSNTTVAYFTALAIFLLTIVLIVKRLIGFMVTLILLAFAVLSGLAIANNDLFREIITSFKYDPTKTNEDKMTYYKHQAAHAYDELKVEFLEQKKKLETMYENYQSAEDAKNYYHKDEVKPAGK